MQIKDLSRTRRLWEEAKRIGFSAKDVPILVDFIERLLTSLEESDLGGNNDAPGTTLSS